MTIEGVVGALPADTAVYQAVTWYLGEVGIRATFRAASYATMVRRNQTGQWDGVDAYAGHWSAGPYNDLQRPLEAYSCLKPRPHFCDRHLSNPLRVVQTEMDPERRQAGLLALSQAFHEQAATIFLIEQVDVFGHSPRIRNLQIANRVPVYEGIELRD
jgi:peptide/nickel transport system substrate-binding protein